jgi:hypothetical protein
VTLALPGLALERLSAERSEGFIALRLAAAACTPKTHPSTNPPVSQPPPYARRPRRGRVPQTLKAEVAWVRGLGALPFAATRRVKGKTDFSSSGGGCLRERNKLFKTFEVSVTTADSCDHLSGKHVRCGWTWARSALAQACDPTKRATRTGGSIGL